VSSGIQGAFAITRRSIPVEIGPTADSHFWAGMETQTSRGGIADVRAA
jgi:hypothetical protein